MRDPLIELKDVLKIVLKHKSTWYRRINPDKTLQIAIFSPRPPRWSRQEIDAAMVSLSPEQENRGTE